MEAPNIQPTGPGLIVFDDVSVTPDGKVIFDTTQAGKYLRKRFGAQADQTSKVGRFRVTFEHMEEGDL